MVSKQIGVDIMEELLLRILNIFLYFFAGVGVVLSIILYVIVKYIIRDIPTEDHEVDG
jgi:uncharacterized membrane protein YhdT